MIKSQYISRNKKKYFEFSLIFGLVLLTILFAFMIKDNTNASSFSGDPTFYISASNNIIKNNGLTVNWIPPKILCEGNRISFYCEDFTTINSIIEDYPSVNWVYKKPPLFFIVQALFFKVLDANPSNWIESTVIITSLIISITFLIVYYFFVRKYFGFEIAFYLL